MPWAELVVAREKHQDGNYHFHVYVKFRETLTIVDPLYFDMRIFNDQGDLDHEADRNFSVVYHGNYQTVRSAKLVTQYCSKGDEYITEGIDVHSLKKQRTTRNLLLLTTSPKELVDLGELSLQNLPYLLKARFAYNMLVPARDMPDVRGIWYWGPPGTGKSHLARSLNPGSTFLKAQNKWWDGY